MLFQTQKNQVLYDLGSMSGSFVNGKKATKIDLKNGDKMTFGETEIIFCVEVKQKKFLGIFQKNNDPTT